MRKCTPLYLSKSGLLTALIAAIFTPHAFAAPAGRVDFVQGSVSATGGSGGARTLTKGDEINSGDIITIGNGRAQIRFSDGAYLALQPNTIFKVDEYAFDGKADGSEKGFFSLLKGGLRTISGLIGKSNRQSYKLNTPNATIGIRGTAFSVTQTDERLIVTVGQGRVSVSNPTGSLTIGSGQSVIVPTPHSPPRMTDEKAAVSQVPTQQQEQQQEQSQQQQPPSSTLISGNQLTSSGTSQPVAVATLPPAPMLKTGPGYAISYAFSESNTSYSALSLTMATFDAGQTLTSFSGSSSLDFATAGTAKETGSDGIIGWGRWVGNVQGTAPGAMNYTNNAQGLHYVVGLPTLTANLPASGSAIYTVVGATLPSTNNFGSYSLGNFAGTATINFGVSPTMTLNATITDPALFPNPYNLANFGAIPLLISSPNAVFTGFANPSSGPMSGATINVNGLFAGTVGERLGVAYSINKFGVITTGAVAFKTP